MKSTQATQLSAQLRILTHEYLQRAAPLLRGHGRPNPEIIIRFDLRGKAAGQVIWRHGRPPQVRYNLAMALLQPVAFVDETVPHEVAHIVVGCCFPRARPHGSEWRSVMAYFGISVPQRCHHFTLANNVTRRQRRWTYYCGCSEHQLSTTRHNRAQQSAIAYFCRSCGQPLHRLASAADGADIAQIA